MATASLRHLERKAILSHVWMSKEVMREDENEEPLTQPISFLTSFGEVLWGRNDGKHSFFLCQCCPFQFDKNTHLSRAFNQLITVFLISLELGNLLLWTFLMYSFWKQYIKVIMVKKTYDTFISFLSCRLPKQDRQENVRNPSLIFFQSKQNNKKTSILFFFSPRWGIIILSFHFSPNYPKNLLDFYHLQIKKKLSTRFLCCEYNLDYYVLS